MSTPIPLSVIVPVRPGVGDPLEACAAVKKALTDAAGLLEFVIVLDGPAPELERRLIEQRASGQKVRIVRLARASGEAAAIKAGLGFASEKLILTFPADLRVDPEDLPGLLAALNGHDLAMAVRRPPRGRAFARLRRSLYGALANSLFGVRVGDLDCAVHVGRREVFEEIPLYGGHHRFLPAFAHRLGFRVAAIEVQARADAAPEARTRRPGGTVGLLDLLAMFFLTRFSRKPLRFFGLLGGPVFGAGLIAFVYLLYIKLLHGRPLANRPLLLLAVLLLVLGVQIIALGLVAEIIVFTHLRDVQEYSVEEITN